MATVSGRYRDLTNAKWEILNTLIPEPAPHRDGRGRPWKDRRAVLNGILWVLRTGAPWADVPDRYPSYQTCHRRFQQWVRSGVMKGILEALALDLKARGSLDVREALIDRSFAPAKKGAPRLERQSVAKARKSWRLQIATVCP
jgi:transposase